MSNFQVRKSDAELQIVWAEVYTPGIPDSQGDFMVASEIMKAAYRFLALGRVRQIDLDHNGEICGCIVVESFIARDGDLTFNVGAWVVAIHIPNIDLWQAVKDGEYNGLSLEGDGQGIERELELNIEFPITLRGKTYEALDHDHTYSVAFDTDGQLLGGKTFKSSDGHSHKVVKGTITEPAGDPPHTHRIDITGLLVEASKEE